MNEKEFAEVAAAYALGALSPAEREAFERACAARPEWVSRLDEDMATAVSLTATVPEESPRPEVRERLFAELDASIAAGEPPSAMRVPETDAVLPASSTAVYPSEMGSEEQASAGFESSRNISERDEATGFEEDSDDDPLRPRSRSIFTRVLAVVATAALIAGVGSGLFISLQPQQPPGVVALEQVQAARDAQRAALQVPGGGEAMLVWSESQGTAVLMTAGLPAAPSGHTYELWYVRGEARIPAGTFDPDERGAATVLVAGEMHEGDTVAVTVEVTGGAPDGVPSDQLVFAIPTGSAGTST